MSGHNVKDYSQLKVLIVEDNEVNQKVTQAMLQSFNISSDIAENGRVALDKFADSNYDLILMDCQMPVLNGLETTGRIRELEKEYKRSKEKLVIIAMTANAAPEDVDACYNAGMDDFIPKPVELDIIHSILEKWYGNT